MSKNIVMQELTASGYEELYPKTNTQEIVSSNTTINQFLGGGESLEDALGYLAGLNQHWWLKKSEENVYGLKETELTKNYIYIMSRNSDFVVSGKKGSAVSVNQKTGALSLVNSENFSQKVQYGTPDEGEYWPRSVFGAANSDYIYWRGDYYYAHTLEGDTFYNNHLYFSYRNSDTYAITINDKSLSYVKTYQLSSEVVGTKPTYSYVSSPNPSAYPDNGATQDNAQYWYIGQPFTYLPRLGKVEVGSYVGTGLSSWSIIFENTPQFVHISSNTAPNNQVGFWINPKQVLNYWVRSGSQSTISSILSEKTLSCSSSSAAMNNTNTTYQYFAITQ